MTTRKILDRGSADKAERTIRSRTRLRILLVLPVAATAAVALAACGSPSAPSAASSPGGGSSPAAAAALSVKTAEIGSAMVLTNAKGFTLYAFSPDTSTTSKCVGTCAHIWPPVPGPVATADVKGTFGTIKRADGTTQATSTATRCTPTSATPPPVRPKAMASRRGCGTRSDHLR